MKREVPVEQALGMVLAHDLTRIVPGEFKGSVFKKGHVVREEDIPLLLDIGKRFIYAITIEDDELHEEEAAVRMAEAVAGPGLTRTEPHEGKVVLKAAHPGVLVVDEARVFQMNSIDGIAVTTRVPYIHADAGMSVAGVRPIPLIIEKAKVEEVERIAREGGKAIDVIPYRQGQKAVIVTTGSEIASGRIIDKSGPVLREKLAKYDVPVLRQVFPGDEQADISAEIRKAVADGATLVCVTGGMSVDPDDRSPAAIRAAVDRVVTYGTPMLPGSMMMLAYAGEVAVFGLPGAVIFDKVTSFDILLPRILADLPVTKADIAKHGVGGWLNA